MGAAVFTAVPTFVGAVPLDFSAGSFDSLTDTLTFTEVAAGIDMIVAPVPASTWVSFNEARNGSANDDDGQINVATGTTAHLEFSFIDTGTGEPAILNEVNLAFFDLDFAGKEKLTLKTEGLTITRVDTLLDIETEPGAVTLSGASKVNVPNITDSDDLSDEQEQATVLFSLPTLSSFELSFEAGGIFGDGRNFLFDGDFEFSGPTTILPFPPAPVPLPAAGLMLLVGLGCLRVGCRRA